MVYLIFSRLAAKLSEPAENFRNNLIKIQLQMSFDLNNLNFRGLAADSDKNIY